jgi:hypothetical protein
LDGLKIKSDKTGSKKLSFLYKCPYLDRIAAGKKNAFGYVFESDDFTVI